MVHPTVTFADESADTLSLAANNTIQPLEITSSVSRKLDMNADRSRKGSVFAAIRSTL